MQIDEDVSNEKLVFSIKVSYCRFFREGSADWGGHVRLVKLRFPEKCVPALGRERDFEKNEERPRCKLKSSQVRL